MIELSPNRVHAPGCVSRRFQWRLPSVDQVVVHSLGRHHAMGIFPCTGVVVRAFELFRSCLSQSATSENASGRQEMVRTIRPRPVMDGARNSEDRDTSNTTATGHSSKVLTSKVGSLKLEGASLVLAIPSPRPCALSSVRLQQSEFS